MQEREDRIRDLLLDNRFVDWVINPQSPYAGYWLQWVRESPANQLIAEEARLFLLELRKSEADHDEEVSDQVADEILQRVHSAIDNDNATPRATRRSPWYWAAAAAVFITFVIFGIRLFNHRAPATETASVPVAVPSSSTELVRFNGSQHSELVYLPDGSKVALAKGARIVYNRLMNGKQRNVSLTGEAIFDVAKNPDKPFYIRTQNMIIKVLGTSFRVTASPKEESVVVKTGRVSVYLKEQDLEASAPKILLPRQACTFSSASRQLLTSSYAGPAAIGIAATNSSEYNFEDAPLDNVLQALQKMYSLSIEYDRDTFKNCFVTISLENESLEEKLEVLTKTVGASFIISDDRINIHGTGCR